MRKLTARVLALALAAAAGTFVLATAPTTAVADQKKLDVRKEVREKVSAAQAAGQKGNFSEAIRQLKEAKAIGNLKPDEEYAVNELLIWAANGARDYKLLTATIEERLATGRVGGSDKVQKLNVLANAYYSSGELRKAVEAAQRLIAARGGNGTADDLTLLATAQFQLKDYKAASGTLERAYAASAGKSVKSRSALLEMLNAAYYDLGETDKRMQTLVRLLSIAPTSKTFEQIANAIGKQAEGDTVIMLNVYRLGVSKNVLTKDHYAKFVDAALELLSPGEAVTVLEKAVAIGAVKKEDRTTRLLADSKKQVQQIKTNLPQQEKEARALATGEGDVRLATNYFTTGEYAKAIEAARRGIGKGRVKRLDAANMMLGIALVETRKGAEARAAFQAATAANPKMKAVADLWISVAT